MSTPIDESYQLGQFRDNEDSLRRLKSQAAIALELEFDHLQQAGLKPGQRVLDVGCGPGIITTQIALRMVPEHLLALDCNQISLTETRAQLAAAGVSGVMVQQGNLYDAELTAPDQFDFAYARLVFQHLSEPLRALRNIRNSLVDGGRACICDIDDRWLGVAPQTDALGSFMSRVAAAQSLRGGDRHVGSKLAQYLFEAGYHDVQCTMLPVSTTLIGKQAFCDLVFGYKMEVISEAELAEAQQERARIEAQIHSDNGWAGIGVFFVSGRR